MKTLLWLFVIIIILAPLASFATNEEPATNTLEELKQLRLRVEQLEKKILETNQPLPAAREEPVPAASTLDAMRKAARDEIDTTFEEPDRQSEFTFGALGLQALNPEISVTGDMLGSYTDSKTTNRKLDFLFRGLGIHLESYLDPYTHFKAAFEVNESGARLGEAYMTRYGLLPQVNVTLGKFRQQFGVVNRWHKHALDQVDFPLPLRMIFGDGGLNQTGGAIEWTMPDFAGLSHETIAQITDGSNSRVFGENADNIPSALLRYRMYRDLSPSTYAELGTSALYGQNNQWPVNNQPSIDKSLDTLVFGIDYSMVWEPTDRMRYHNVTWRTEAYALDKAILAPDGSGRDTLTPWGAYSYLEAKVCRTLALGMRVDYYQPNVKPYATGTTTLSPLAVTEDGAQAWQFSPYVTWEQSPYVHFRVEYDYANAHGMDMADNVVWLQCVFAAGPHKHDRY